MCVLDLPSDSIYIQIHNNGPAVHSIYIFDTVQNAFQLILLDSFILKEHCWILAWCTEIFLLQIIFSVNSTVLAKLAS